MRQRQDPPRTTNWHVEHAQPVPELLECGNKSVSLWTTDGTVGAEHSQDSRSTWLIFLAEGEGALMKRSTKVAIVALALALLAGLAFTSAIYYAWVAVTPGCDIACNSMYNRVSTILAYASYVIAALAAVAAIVAFVDRPRKI